MNNKNCGQVNIPQVDNTSTCNEYTGSACVIVERSSTYVKNPIGENLDQYLERLEGLLRRAESRIKTLEKVVKHLSS